MHACMFMFTCQTGPSPLLKPPNTHTHKTQQPQRQTQQQACLDVTQQLKEGVRAISGLGLVAEPEFVSLAILSRDARVDILLVGDAMEERGACGFRVMAPVGRGLVG